MGFFIKQNINMLKPTSIEQDAGCIAYSGDIAAHVWVVSISNSAGYTAGKTAAVLFALPSGLKVETSAIIDGDNISIKLPQIAYSENGSVTAYMQIHASNDTEVTTIAVLRFIVTDCASGTINVPSDIILPVKELTDKYIALTEQYSDLTEIDTDAVDNITSAMTINKTAKTVKLNAGYHYQNIACGHKRSISTTGGASSLVEIDISSYGFTEVQAVNVTLTYEGAEHTSDTQQLVKFLNAIVYAVTNSSFKVEIYSSASSSADAKYCGLYWQVIGY